MLTDTLFADKAQMFASLVEGLPAMFIVVKFQGQDPVFEYVSPFCLELTGFRQDELIGRSSMLALSYPGDIPQGTSFKRMEEKHGVTPDNSSFESVFRIVTASGEIKWVKEFGKIVFDSQGQQQGIYAVVLDYSNAKSLELLFEKNVKDGAEQDLGLGPIIGKSPAMQGLYQKLRLVALSEAPLLITGETGVGKEMAARAVHQLSVSDQPFVAVNCGGVNENLLENELFGHIKGAYTGASTNSIGLLGQANNGILFLDEIGDIPLSMQIKLLRTLDGYGYIPLGGTKTLDTKFRLISATNKNLQELLLSGKMRHDFFFRIQALHIEVPPLRQRPEDIPLLVDYFLKLYSKPDSEAVLPNHVRLSLQEHQWPGNVRELRNEVQRYLTLGELNLTRPNQDQRPDTPDPAPNSVPDYKRTKAEREIAMLREAVVLSNGHREKAAAFLGVHPRTLYRKLKKYGLS